jgi:hypothetical protein
MTTAKTFIHSSLFMLVKMSLVVTAIDVLLMIGDDEFEFNELLLSLLVNCVGVFVIYGIALVIPPMTKTNPFTAQDDIVSSIYSEAVQDLFLDEEHRGVFHAKSGSEEGTYKEYLPILDAEELFVTLNTYQKVLVGIRTKQSKTVYEKLDSYKSEAKFMIDNPHHAKGFVKA